MTSFNHSVFPLSFAQQRLWFLAQMEGGSAAYYLPFGLRLKGKLNSAALQQALDRIVTRHEALRTNFAVVEGEPVQRIAPEKEGQFRLASYDLRQHSNAETELQRLKAEEAAAGFDLESGSLIRGRLVRLADEEHVLLITMHHIVSDGWSVGVFLKELGVLYGAYAAGGEDPLPQLEVQYADYTVWQRKSMEGEVLRGQGEYWKKQLAGAPTLLEIPKDRARPAEQDHAGGWVPLELDTELTVKLRELSRSHGTTLYMTLLAAWGALLGRLSGQREAVIGTPVANRRRMEIEGLIGFFVNTLAMRLDVSGSLTVRELLKAVKKETLAAQQHQDIPFEQVVEVVQPVRSLAYSPLFQVMFAWQNAREGNLAFPELEAELLGMATHEIAKFDLTLVLGESGNAIVGGVEYATALFERATIDRYLGYFRHLLEGMVAGSDQAIADLGILPEVERRQVLYEWNATGGEYRQDKCIHELFEEQVAKTPGATALVFEDQSVSYAELNRRANQLGHYLRQLGVKADDRVGICVERGIEMVVALLAVLKAGGGYVPLDPAYPVERLNFMLQDSGAEVLLTQGHLRKHFTFPGINESLLVVDLSATILPWQEQPESNAGCGEAGVTGKSLAYVIYTSGSTGTPKGVMVEHGQVVRLFSATEGWYEFDEKDVWTQFHSYAFDFSVWEIWGALLYGGRLVVVPWETARSPEKFYELVCRGGVTVLNQTPSAFGQLIAAQGQSEQQHQLRYVIFGGERLEVAALRPWYEQNQGSGTQLVNMYGITETTVHVTYRPLEEADALKGGGSPIGRQIPDLKIYILDQKQEPVPVGVVGELYVGGAGVARGYLNREELTAERFLRDPFAGDGGGRMYKTGDLGRWLGDGNIEYLGRNDFQVKVRGFRIELGEIEARLLEQEGVKEAVVVAREEQAGEQRLVAYYTYTMVEEGEGAGKEVGAEELRRRLLQKLPEYMVPAAYVRLEKLPLTVNGKIDRKALPAPEGEVYGVGVYEEPVGEMETAVAKIWAEVLKVEFVGRRDNFFHLGGHSLLAMRVITRLQQLLSIEVSITDLFARPVLADLVAGMESAARAELPSITRVAREERIPLSYAQQRLWFLAQMKGVAETYHGSCGLRLNGRLDHAALRKALDRIVARHEVLRTCFVVAEREAVQRIARSDESRFHLVEEDWRDRSEDEADLQNMVVLEGRRAFDLENGPLIRGRLVQKSDEEHVLLITMHHIVSDGWSMGVFLKELSLLYGAYAAGGEDPLPELEVQYADYAVWQRKWMEGDVLRGREEYWKRKLEGAPALLEVPKDHARPAEQVFTGGWVKLELGKELTAGLKELSRRHGMTLYMTLLAGWGALLSRLSGQKDIVIGTPVANRGRMEIEGLIGFFLNMLALRLDLSGSPTVDELLERVKSETLAAQQHQDIPFERVVEITRPERSLAQIAQSPLFQVGLSWQNAPRGGLILPGLEVRPLEDFALSKMARLDLMLFLQDQGDVISGGVEYATALFEQSTVEKYLGYLRNLLEGMVADDWQELHDLPMLPERERQQVLYEWNGTEVEYPQDKCIHELFEEQVERTPGATAVVFEDENVSYGELNQRANQLAHYLRTLGVKADERVGICVERGIEMVVGLLGVLKAGGAYMPLDPEYPEERLQYMIKDSQPVAVLTQAHLQARLTAVTQELPVIDLASAALPWQEQPETNPDRDEVGLTPEHLAYVIYTSGSTGLAKGVMIEHRQITNYVAAISDKLGLQPGLSYGLVSTFAADLGNTVLYPSLVRGGVLHIFPVRATKDADLFHQYCHKRGIDCLKITPSHFQALLGDGGFVDGIPRHRLIFGGEALSGDLLATVRRLRPECHIYNHYGPTECTVGALSEEVTKFGSSGKGAVPLGRPLANTKIYILDSHLNPLPVGVTGEIYIGGAGVARGYLNRPELSAERFVLDPFAVDDHQRMYKTGDLARWRADGSVDFLGRNDFQVKIRGYRVELGEIEARLLELESVREAVVMAREADGDKRLVAYVVPEKDHARPLLQILRMEQNGELPRAARYELPNGMLISHQNKGDTDYLYEEIFERKRYLQHGIKLEKNGCVVDVGANIGLFALSVLQHAPQASIYAFESSPAVFESLRINALVSGGNVRPFNCGLSNENLMRAHLEQEQIAYPLRTLSDIITAERIERVDLLKINLQNSELQVLEGIELKDWHKIRQIVVGVHDIEGRLSRIRELLASHGYQVEIEQDELLETTNQHTIYARRTENCESVPISPSTMMQAGPVYWNPNQLATAVRAHLAVRLPEHMVPTMYVCLEKLPLTPNGKLDRKALPEPEAEAHGVGSHEAPVDEIEVMVAEIWAELLKVDRVGRHDNFFELGGHSLLAVTLVERMRRAGLEMDVRVLFATPTVAGLAAATVPQAGLLKVPPNQIPFGCDVIQPEMLPLVKLSVEQIERIVGGVPGGAANVQDIYPLAPLQEGILFHHLMSSEGDPYLLAFVRSFDSRERLDRYVNALQAVVDRHDILRTGVVWEGLAEPVQVVWRKAELVVEEVELEGANGKKAQQLYERYSPRRQRIDIRQAPLLRIYITHDVEKGSWLMLELRHHLTGDHTTSAVMREEIEAYLLGQEQWLAEPLPFRNLVAQVRLGVSEEEHEKYFRELLGDVDEPTAPFEMLNVQGDGKGTKAGEVKLDRALVNRLRERARKLGVSVASVCHVGWAQVLARVSGRQDVVFGTVLVGRMQGGEGSDRAMGLFMNTLPVRIKVGGEGAESSVRGAHEQLAELLRHEHAPLALAQRCSGVVAPLPLFSALLNYRHSADVGQNSQAEKRKAWEGIELYYGEGRNNYPFGLSVDDMGDDLVLTAQVTEARVDPKRICRYMERALESLVEALEIAPETALARLPILPEEERRQVLYEWNATEAEYPRDKCIHELFEEQVERTPGATAVVFEEESVSYEELNRRANQLAHYLRGVGVKTDERVGICVERGIEMVVGLLGVVKAGGAYVPLDPGYPVERLNFMLQDSGARVLLTQGHLQGLFGNAVHERAVVLDLMDDTIWREQAESNPKLEEVGLRPNHLAYVIYTSGSTGVPKGVMVEHGGLVNLAQAQRAGFGIEKESRVLQFASFSFDACASEVWVTLCAGSSLHVAGRDEVLGGETLQRVMVEQEITHVTLPPAVLSALGEGSDLGSVKTLIVAGEKLGEAVAKRWGEGRRLINAYGPTEGTVCATMHECKAGQAGDPPIGKPIANTRVYILDGEQEPVPVGVTGEIYIGGAGVGRGYLNREELTGERFLRDPFAGDGGGRMYKTGDLGRWVEDGNIEYLGRNDFQVKVRGFRIELGEIEARLLEQEGVREAAVVAREDRAGDKRLVAYVVPQKAHSMEFWPSVAEHFVYDDLLYHAMTNDERRNHSYKVAIRRTVKEKVVVDIGTGKDAILSRFCVEAGASKVYAIELLEDTYMKAKACIERLGLEDKIILMHGDATRVELPEKADVCVSEIVGPIGGCEGACQLINNAWRFMKPDGIMIPQRTTTRIAAVNLPDELLLQPRFSQIGQHYVQRIFQDLGYERDIRICVRGMSRDNLISSVGIFEDINHGVYSAPQYERIEELSVTHNSRIDGFLLWLNLYTTDDEMIDTLDHEHCWLPVYFPVFHPGIDVAKGDTIRVKITSRLCDHGVNPDYHLVGELTSKDAGIIPFEYDSYHCKRVYKQTLFYQALFGAQELKTSDADLLHSELHTHLKQYLPEYMIPAAFVQLKSLPLTANGKLDRTALPAPEDDAYGQRGYEEPVGRTETAIARVWSEVLKVERIGRGDSFFQLGGHSLLAVRVVSLLEQEGIKLEVGDLFAHPTIEKLTKLGLGRKAALNDEAICFRKGAGTPLFLTHEGTGVLLYVPVLSRHIDMDIPVYGLPAQRLDETPLRTVEGMAQRLIKIMRRVQPVGPYRVAGWSLGGMLAYEIATQLIGADEKVEFVGLLDPSYLEEDSRVAGLENSLDLHDLLLSSIEHEVPPAAMNGIKLMAASMDFSAFVEKCQELSLLPQVFSSVTAAELQGYYTRRHALTLSANQYRPLPLPVPIHLFAAQDNKVGDPTLGWGQVVPREQLRMIPVPGTHRSMMSPENVGQTCKALSQAICAASKSWMDLPEQSYSPPLPLQCGKQGITPMFYVPGAGDSITSFVDLVGCLDNQWPVHGLQPRGLDGELVPHSTVRATADCCLRALDEIYPAGPLHLLGHSFGGWVVFEMAHLLSESGRDIASLTILDSESPCVDVSVTREYNNSEVMNEWVNSFELLLQHPLISRSELSSCPESEQLRLVHKCLVREGLMHRGSDPEALRGPLRAFATALRAQYRPDKTYTGKVHLVLTADPKLDHDANRKREEDTIAQWRQWAPNLVSMHAVGNHLTILKPPHVRALAHLIYPSESRRARAALEVL